MSEVTVRGDTFKVNVAVDSELGASIQCILRMALKSNKTDDTSCIGTNCVECPVYQENLQIVNSPKVSNLLLGKYLIH